MGEGEGEIEGDGGGDDDFDEDEFTTEAVVSRMRELQQDFVAHGTSSKESANIFYQLVKDKKESLADANVQKELLREAERLDFKDKAVLILCELLFTENMFDEIKTHRILLLRFCNENPKAQKYLLGGFEKLVGEVYKVSISLTFLRTHSNRFLNNHIPKYSRTNYSRTRSRS